MRLRFETPADADAIDALLARAFAGHPHSHQTEGAIVRALRAAAPCRSRSSPRTMAA